MKKVTDTTANGLVIAVGGSVLAFIVFLFLPRDTQNAIRHISPTPTVTPTSVSDPYPGYFCKEFTDTPEGGECTEWISDDYFFDPMADYYDKLDEAAVRASVDDHYEDMMLATADAPDPTSCLIKGNVSIDTGERIYHVPGQEYYEVTRIDERYGERWFCTEQEAVAAGWRRSRR